ncbi:asparagine synthase (glutamine-hydrolysing) [Psychrobacillus sp. OK028]|uniref:asparagine synthase (glutamine-hydrolyzing) n=1 Tax=Psychrobacillus sp. OK028 TaxID=1884359 RepID=UPI00088E37D1|nr:asparagine synthase (glutamine-hydrolyzing) [Psychrobacillus sp. OK028]SDN45454.1 asparagine synthase (glutamine-hydrolysing) [Psychrobacillus sp. OK028]
MCGITGWIHFQRDLRNELSAVVKMTGTLKKRGPDDDNIWSSPHAAFGHRRLTVVDPVGGKQPMTKNYQSNEYTLTYNGELYNTEDLRKELLKRGHTFSGHSDTEVLLTSYIEWKEKCLNYLNGIFAFAIWDQLEQKVFIARDRLGVKPLFYTEKNGGFLFGSEQKSLFAHPAISPILNRDGLAEIIGLGPSYTPGSGVYKDIKELRPAHALSLTRNGLRTWRYWNVESKEHTDSLDETIEKVRFLVTDAVERQLVSDVPLCTFLSGGLDSSIITSIAAKSYSEDSISPLHTYSIDYQDNDKHFQGNTFQPSNDLPWIQKVTNHLDTKHHFSIISQQKLAEHLREAVHVRDLPGMADIDSSLLWFCREIKHDFTVGLSGECADEIFGGYPWFHQVGNSEKGFPWIRSSTERVQLLNDSWQGKLQIEEYVQNAYKTTLSETPLLEGETTIEAKRRELFYMNMTWFMTTLLVRKDRMSMGASLEVRVPFADHRLVEYAWNIPWEYKMVGNQEKGILRKAFEGSLPFDVLYRKKSPYPKTHNPVYTGIVSTMLKEQLEDKNSILHELFQKQRLKDLVESNGEAFKVPWFGQLMSGPQLLAYLVQMHIWFKDYDVQLVD